MRSPSSSCAPARSFSSAKVVRYGSVRLRYDESERFLCHGRLRILRMGLVLGHGAACHHGNRCGARTLQGIAYCIGQRRGRSMKPRTRRFAWIAAGLAALGVAAALVLNAFQSNLVFFFSPSQVAAREAPQGRAFRIGGMVESGSLAREPNSLTVRFLVTDTAKTIPVTYTGLLPD